MAEAGTAGFLSIGMLAVCGNREEDNEPHMQQEEDSDMNDTESEDDTEED